MLAHYDSIRETLDNIHLVGTDYKAGVNIESLLENAQKLFDAMVADILAGKPKDADLSAKIASLPKSTAIVWDSSILKATKDSALKYFLIQEALQYAVARWPARGAPAARAASALSTTDVAALRAWINKHKDGPTPPQRSLKISLEDFLAVEVGRTTTHTTTWDPAGRSSRDIHGGARVTSDGLTGPRVDEGDAGPTTAAGGGGGAAGDLARRTGGAATDAVRNMLSGAQRGRGGARVVVVSRSVTATAGAAATADKAKVLDASGVATTANPMLAAVPASVPVDAAITSVATAATRDSFGADSDGTAAIVVPNANPLWAGAAAMLAAAAGHAPETSLAAVGGGAGAPPRRNIVAERAAAMLAAASNVPGGMPAGVRGVRGSLEIVHKSDEVIAEAAMRGELDRLGGRLVVTQEVRDAGVRAVVELRESTRRREVRRRIAIGAGITLMIGAVAGVTTFFLTRSEDSGAAAPGVPGNTTSTSTPSPGASSTVYRTLTASVTVTPSPSGPMVTIASNTGSISFTASATGTATPTVSVSSTGSMTVSPSFTPTPTPTPTSSLTRGASASTTATGSGSASVSSTGAPSLSPSFSFTPSGSATATITMTMSNSNTVTMTVSPSYTVTVSPSPSGSLSSTGSPTMTMTVTNTATGTVTATQTISATESTTVTVSNTGSITTSPTMTPSSTGLPVCNVPLSRSYTASAHALTQTGATGPDSGPTNVSVVCDGNVTIYGSAPSGITFWSPSGADYLKASGSFPTASAAYGAVSATNAHQAVVGVHGSCVITYLYNISACYNAATGGANATSTVSLNFGRLLRDLMVEDGFKAFLAEKGASLVEFHGRVLGGVDLTPELRGLVDEYVTLEQTRLEAAGVDVPKYTPTMADYVAKIVDTGIKGLESGFAAGFLEPFIEMVDNKTAADVLKQLSMFLINAYLANEVNPYTFVIMALSLIAKQSLPKEMYAYVKPVLNMLMLTGVALDPENYVTNVAGIVVGMLANTLGTRCGTALGRVAKEALIGGSKGAAVFYDTAKPEAAVAWREAHVEEVCITLK